MGQLKIRDFVLRLRLLNIPMFVGKESFLNNFGKGTIFENMLYVDNTFFS